MTTTTEFEIEDELDWITLKCLEKDRRRRYDSAHELVADIRRYLNGEPVLAVAPTYSYQFKKFYQRHRAMVHTLVLVWLALFVGLVTTTWQWRSAEAQRHTAEAAKKVADEKTAEAEREAARAHEQEENALNSKRQTEATLYRSNIARASLELLNYNAVGANAVLEQCPDQFRGWEWQILKQRVESNMFTLEGHTSWVFDVKCSPDGRWIASTGGGDPELVMRGEPAGPGEVIVWDADTGQRMRDLPGHQDHVAAIAFSPDSRTLATVCKDGMVRLWDAETGELLKAYTYEGKLSSVTYSPNGELLAVGTVDGKILIWDRASDQRRMISQHSSWVNAVRFSRDSRVLYSLSSHLTAWDIVDWKERPMNRHQHEGDGLAVSFANDRISTSAGRGLRFFDSKNGTDFVMTDVHSGEVTGIAENPNRSGNFATCSIDSTIQLWWGMHGQTPWQRLLGHRGRVLAIDYTPDGSRIVSGGSDGTVRVWGMAQNLKDGDIRIPTPVTALESVAFTRGSNYFKVVRDSGHVLKVDVNDHTTISEDQLPTRAPGSTIAGLPSGEFLSLDSTGEFLVGLDEGDSSLLKCWELATSEERVTLRHQLDSEHLNLTCNPEAKRIAAGGNLANDNTTVQFYVWDGRNGDMLFHQSLHGELITRLALSDDGHLLAVACTTKVVVDPPQKDREHDNVKQRSNIRLFDLKTKKEIAVFDQVDDAWYAIDFDQQGQRLVAAGMGRSVIIWDLSNKSYISSRQGITNALDLSINSAGTRLAIVSSEQTKILNANSAQELLVLQNARQRLFRPFGAQRARVCWSHDDRSLAVAYINLSVWNFPDTDQRPRRALTEEARRRAISHRLCATHKNAHEHSANKDIARREMPVIGTLQLNSRREFTMRAEIYQKLGEPEKAARDYALAEQWQQDHQKNESW